jgi:lysophospholipid acyltransferase (LPLAT)-like uncharacterized protein
MLRQLIRHPWTQRLLAWLLGAYLGFCYRTSRWSLLGAEHLEGLATARQPMLLAFWHERLPMIPMLWRLAQRRFPQVAGWRPHVLVSQHRDGRFIGEVVARFGLATVHGSTSRGGAAGLRGLLRVVKGGDPVAITPDGPRGPRRQAAEGVAVIAGLAGVPVLPLAAATTRHRLLPSWDRMMLPLPFGRAVLVCGPAIEVPREAAAEAVPAIEAALNAACDRADAWVAGGGRPAGDAEERPL